ncbi:MAG: D-Ala-D-Ala carboxypeptidase family metallohydrolase [Pseudomonadales bacterium]
MSPLKLCFAVLGLSISLGAGALPQSQLSFGVKVNGIENRYEVFGVFAVPGQRLNIELLDLTAEGAQFHFDDRVLHPQGGSLSVRMPENPGTHRLEISTRSGEEMRLNVFVMWTESGLATDVLNGYRLGAYPGKPLKGLTIYEAPRAFIEATPENADTRVSPNFTLGHFLCKQSSGFPKYLVLRPELIQKLEIVLSRLNADNPGVTDLTVMSGFRTPAYNRSIGNGEYSRHVWGDAADVFVDMDRNGAMDDLNRDGRISRADSEWLATFVDRLERNGTFGESVGGIGIYDSTPSHGPFVHIDARGFKARW